MRLPIRGPLIVGVVCLSFLASFAVAEDAYFEVPAKSLNLKLPPATNTTTLYLGEPLFRTWPRVLLDGPGEAYAQTQDHALWNAQRPDPEKLNLCIAAPAGKPVSGRLLVYKGDSGESNLGQDLQEFHFTIPAASADPNARTAFFRAKARHYQRLLQEPIAGGAWFRHQLDESLKAIGKQDDPAFQMRRTQDRDAELDDSYALFTGSRAISENLQLHRSMPAPTQHSESPVKIDSIKGIDVKSIDWKPLLADAKPATDPLAALIPIDQPAAIFPSVKQLAAVLGAAKKQSVPLLEAVDPQFGAESLPARYAKQICHNLADLTALSEAGLIDSIAITASDPYVQTGTDLAIILQSKKPAELHDQLMKKITAAQGAKPAKGDVDGLAYAGASSPHREISAFVATLDGAVVLTNSTAQLKQLAAVKKGSSQSLTAAPEYAFFRNRYALGAEDESAFVILTDATIRKWCSARWRIADSRRTRAAVLLEELTAQNSDALVDGTAQPKPLTTTLLLENPGTLELSASGVSSSTYNTLAFMTPIAELDLPEVTKSEAAAYERWRDGYQRDWSWAFDPIAMRLSVARDHLRGDLTVMPLIDASEYKEMIEVSRGATIKPGSGDPHEALAQVAYALNVDSQPMKELAMQAAAFMPNLKVQPLEWIGQTVSFYADEDPFWNELSAAKNPEEFMNKNIGRLPMGLNFEVRDGMRAVLFLTGLRGFVDGAAPGMVKWEPQIYNGRAYVRVSATNEGRKSMGEDFPDLSIYYAISGDGFVLTPSEAVLKRALDRQILRKAATSQPDAAAKLPTTRPWLGQSLALQLKGGALEVLSKLTGARFEQQANAWSNLPILNEYKRLYPKSDPVAVYRQLWAADLPGKYTWSETWQTMQSTEFGSPEEPKNSTRLPDILMRVRDGNFGIDFEGQGIRARGEVNLKPADIPSKPASGAEFSP